MFLKRTDSQMNHYDILFRRVFHGITQYTFVILNLKTRKFAKFNLVNKQTEKQDPEVKKKNIGIPISMPFIRPSINIVSAAD